MVSEPHTSDYKRGYADGQSACSKNGGDSNPPSGSNMVPQPGQY